MSHERSATRGARRCVQRCSHISRVQYGRTCALLGRGMGGSRLGWVVRAAMRAVGMMVYACCCVVLEESCRSRLDEKTAGLETHPCKRQQAIFSGGQGSMRGVVNHNHLCNSTSVATTRSLWSSPGRHLKITKGANAACLAFAATRCIRPPPLLRDVLREILSDVRIQTGCLTTVPLIRVSCVSADGPGRSFRC